MSNFALRLQPSLLDEARKLSEAEGVALNQFINANTGTLNQFPNFAIFGWGMY